MATEIIEDTVRSILTAPVPQIRLQIIESNKSKDICHLQTLLRDLEIKKLYLDIYHYQMLYNGIIEIDDFFKTIDNLIKYMMKIGEINLTEVYKVEIRKIFKHLKDKIIFSNNKDTLMIILILQRIQYWI